MAQYINKEALIAYIKASIKDIEVSQKAGLIKKRDADKKMFLFKNVLSLVNTLEVKEVDLEEELQRFNKEIIDDNDFFNPLDIAEHFFGLGLKAQKGK